MENSSADVGFSGEDKVFSVRFSKVELEQVATAANEAGLAVGPYICRRALMQRTAPDPDLLKVRALRSVGYQLEGFRQIVPTRSEEVNALFEEIGRLIDEVANDW